MKMRSKTFTATLPAVAAFTLCSTVLVSPATADEKDAVPDAANAVKLPDELVSSETQGGVAGAGFIENFEGAEFAIGLFAGVNGWCSPATGCFGANMYITDVAPIEGLKSAVHVADGTGLGGFELDSPNFGPAFGALVGTVRLTGNDTTYDFVSLDTDTTFFNTRVRFQPTTDVTNPQGIEVSQINTNPDPATLAFFDTGIDYVVGTEHEICVRLDSAGNMAVFVDGVLGLLGTSMSADADAAGIVTNGNPYAGHGRYMTFSDNTGTGGVNDMGTGDINDDIATGAGTNYYLDDLNETCADIPLPVGCPADTNGSGTVDGTDLVNVILDWGTNGSVNNGDVDGSGTVDGTDLVAVILAWGPCPPSTPAVADDCANSILIFFGGSTLFNNEGTTTDPLVPAMSCPNPAGNDIFYRYQAECSGDLTIDTIGSTAGGLDTLLEVYAGWDCATMTSIQCDDDGAGAGLDSRVTLLDVTEGDQFTIRIGGGITIPLTSEGDGVLNIDCLAVAPDPPANDDCVNAEPVTLGATLIGQTISATADPDAFPCGNGNLGTDPTVTPGAPGVWYRVTGTGTRLSASMCSSPDPYDSVIQIFCGSTSDCDPGPGLLCQNGDDDGCGMLGDGTVSVVTWCSVLNDPYLIRVGGFGTSTGNFELIVTDTGAACTPVACTEAPELLNDACIDMIQLGDGLTPYSNIAATDDGPAHPAECDTAGDGGATTEDIWFYYIPTITGVVQITTCEDIPGGGTANHDSDIVMYNAPGLDLTMDADQATACVEQFLLDNLLGCNDDDPINTCGTGGGGFHSTLLVPVTAGENYIVRVGSWFTGNTGDGVLFVNNFVPDNDLCEFADSIDLTNGPANPILVDTAGSGPEPGNPACGAAPVVPAQGGRWLRCTGDGTTYTVTLCNNPDVVTDPTGNGMFDTLLDVFCGPCDDAGCAVDQQDNTFGDCGPNETATWDTFPGQPYLIYIHSQGSPMSGTVDVYLESNGIQNTTPACLPPDECGPGNAGYQPRRLPDDNWVFGTSDTNLGFRRFESFEWAGGNLTDLRWWGEDLRFVAGGGFTTCDQPGILSFEIGIYPDAAGAPNEGSAVLFSGGLNPTKITTGDLYLEIGGNPATPVIALRYDLTLPADPGLNPLPAGTYWLSILNDDGDPCSFLWLDSRVGDDTSYIDNLGDVDPPALDDFDLSYCLNPTN